MTNAMGDPLRQNSFEFTPVVFEIPTKTAAIPAMTRS
jgi:hypothetical protein